MKYLKTIGHYEIHEASEQECKKGVYGMQWEYPCFCVFFDDDEEKTLKTSQSDFSTLEEAEDWCR